MFDRIYERLQALARAEGFDPQAGNRIDAELRGYATALAWVYDRLAQTLDGGFAATAQAPLLWRWMTVRGLLPAKTPEEDRAALLERRRMPWGDFSLASFEQALHKLCGADAGYRCLEGNLELTVSATGRAQLGRFLREWVPPFLFARLPGKGRTWDALDADGVPYAVFDRAALPFDILDTEEEV